jgi:hypothetical protein
MSVIKSIIIIIIIIIVIIALTYHRKVQLNLSPFPILLRNSKYSAYT